jgi:eukaryotic-like serine/threonine-protein kinase
LTDPEAPFGRFKLIRRIAVGGMGEVFLARYLNASGIERLAVVKRILPHLTADPDFVSYFVNEGRITSLLSHPNVVQTLELGRTNNQYYIAMEHIQGATLVRLLSTALLLGKPFSIPMVLHLSTQIASALEYIHNLKSIEGHPLSIIHMDMAPHNILVSPDGQLKLLDFGISRASGLQPNGVRRDFRGRTSYLAPEQLDGLPLDKGVDLFAMGIIMHEMVMCRPLFRAKSEHQTATRILYAPIPRPRSLRRDCPEMLDRIILKTLSRDRTERYADAGEILQELDRCAQVNGIVRSVTQIREEISELMAAIDDSGEIRKPQTTLDGQDFEYRATSVE